MIVLLEDKSTGAPQIVRAAIIAFGFVFIHPFIDGNGRVHRFLIHDMLTRDCIAEQGLVTPVSTHMLQHISEYDMARVYYSKPLMQRVKLSILETLLKLYFQQYKKIYLMN
jgi:Fic family protein